MTQFATYRNAILITYAVIITLVYCHKKYNNQDYITQFFKNTKAINNTIIPNFFVIDKFYIGMLLLFCEHFAITIVCERDNNFSKLCQ